MGRGDVVLHVVESGGGQGDPVVLLHGLAGYSGEWAGLTTELRQEFRVLAFDARGHGGSTRRPTDVTRSAHTDDVAAVIRQLAGGAPVTLVGQSMGAHTAMLTAATHPDLVKRLVMVEGDVGGDLSQLEQVRGWLGAWPVPFPDRQAALDYFNPQGSDRERQVARVWADGLEVRDGQLWPRFDASVLVQSIAGVLTEAAWWAWDGVRQPTLLVLGQHSSIRPEAIAAMVDRRPDTDVIVVADAEHEVHLDQPGALAGLIRNFVAQSPDSASTVR